jgi:hypothetical protein
MITHLDMISYGHRFERKVACRAAKTSSNRERMYVARFPLHSPQDIVLFLHC